VEAIYSGAMPLDLIASGNSASSVSSLASLSTTTAKFDEIEANLATALDLARDCHAAYPAADPQLRRLFDQAFFTHRYIDDAGAHGECAEPFDVLLDAGRAIQANRPTGLVTMADILGRPATSTNDKTPGHCVPLGVYPCGPRHLFAVSRVRIRLLFWAPAGFESATHGLGRHLRRVLRGLPAAFMCQRFAAVASHGAG
jgi:hypothetical protein